MLRSTDSGKGCESSVMLKGTTLRLTIAALKEIRRVIPDLVAELMQLKVDVLVTWTTGMRAAKQATKTIPIVMVTRGSSRDWASR